MLIDTKFAPQDEIFVIRNRIKPIPVNRECHAATITYHSSFVPWYVVKTRVKRIDIVVMNESVDIVYITDEDDYWEVIQDHCFFAEDFALEKCRILNLV